MSVVVQLGIGYSIHEALNVCARKLNVDESIMTFGVMMRPGLSINLTLSASSASL